MSKISLEYYLARRIATPEGGKKNNVMVRIAVVSVAVSVAVMIVSLAVIFGFKRDITGNLSGFGSHIQIVNLDGNTSYETVPIDRNIKSLPHITALNGFASAYAYAIKGGVIKGKETFQSVVLKGVDREYDRSFFGANLVDGALLEFDSVRKKDILVSKTIAAMLELEVGDMAEMIFFDNPPRRDRFKVAGVYDTGIGEMDKIMVIGDLRDVQRLNRWSPEQVTGVEINISDFAQLESFTQRVDDIIFEHDGDSNLRAINIKERFPMIFDWLKMHDYNAAIIIVILLAVALLGMTSALLIILLERTSMIGVLKALGMCNWSLQKMFIIRSSFVILKGMIWGNIIGIGLCLIQHHTGWVTLNQSGYFVTTVPIELQFGWLMIMNLATFIFIVAILTLPTRIISLILPEKSIRFE